MNVFQNFNVFTGVSFLFFPQAIPSTFVVKHTAGILFFFPLTFMTRFQLKGFNVAV